MKDNFHTFLISYEAIFIFVLILQFAFDIKSPWLLCSVFRNLTQNQSQQIENKTLKELGGKKTTCLTWR